MTKKFIVTIGREYGSGGRSIGQMLAKKLDIPYYDKELITVAARESGINEELIEQNDEKIDHSFFSYFNTGEYYADIPFNNKVFLAQFDAIKKIADQGSCVIVGRCADYVLADYKNCCNVFIHARLQDRINQIAKDNNLTPKKAEELINKIDKIRMNYYEFYTGKKWNSVDNYHLTIDSSLVGIKGAVELIMKYLELKIER